MTSDPQTVYEVELQRVEDIAPGTRRLELARPDGFEYVPGQSLSVLLPAHGETVRAYALASPAEKSGPLEIVLDLVPGGAASEYLFSLGPGARLRFTGPCGTFVLREVPAGDCVFIALGTGIAAIRPMLHRAWRTSHGQQLRLHHFVADLARQLYRDEFVRAVRDRANFAYEVLFAVDPVEYLRGRYAHETLERSTHFFVCGAGPEVERIRDLLRQVGCEHVHHQKW